MVWPTLGSMTAKEQNIKYSCQNSVRTAHKLSAPAPNYKPKSTHSASSVILSVAAEVHSSRLVSCVVTDARNSNQTIKYTQKRTKLLSIHHHKQKTRQFKSKQVLVGSLSRAKKNENCKSQMYRHGTSTSMPRITTQTTKTLNKHRSPSHNNVHTQHGHTTT